MLQVVLLYVLGEVIHLKNSTKPFVTLFGMNKTKHVLNFHLHRAGHCAEGKHSGTVLDGGLAVKCSLCVNKNYSNLSGQI